MSTIASRDLRNHTRSVLDQVAAGAIVTVTVNGRPVAEIRSPQGSLRTSLTRVEVSRLLERRQLDDSLGDDLAWISEETTDDLDPLP